MREKSRDIERLNHILEASKRILQYTENATFEELTQNGMMFYAVMMNISIIGEAANLLTNEFRDAHPQTPWKQVRGMRNYLVHDYCNVDNEVVWIVVSEDIPELKNQIEQYLAELSAEEV